MIEQNRKWIADESGKIAVKRTRDRRKNESRRERVKRNITELAAEIRISGEGGSGDVMEEAFRRLRSGDPLGRNKS